MKLIDNLIDYFLPVVIEREALLTYVEQRPPYYHCYIHSADQYLFYHFSKPREPYSFIYCDIRHFARPGQNTMKSYPEIWDLEVRISCD